MNSIEVEQYQVKQLYKLLEAKQYAIPNLQREFVWNVDKACGLLDSMHKGYPIGTLSIWRTEAKNQNVLRHDYHALPRFDSRLKYILFIIDGQQRLSVIYHIMKGDTITNANGRVVDFGSIYFTIDPKKSERFVHTKKPVPGIHYKIADILSSNWRYIYRHESNYKYDRLARCRNALLYYKVISIVMRTNEIEEVEDTFVRINSLGTPISTADRIFAKAKKMNLRYLINGVRTHLKYDFNRIPREALILPITLLYGSKQIGSEGGQEIVNKIQNNDQLLRGFDRVWKDLSPSYGLAVDWLHKNFNIINYDFLPSQNMVSLLTLFFYHNNNAQPSSYQRKQLRKWFWYTAIKSRYSGRGYQKNIQSDYEYISKLGQRKQKPFNIIEKIPIRTIKYTDYSKKSSLADAYYCLLAHYEPQYLNGGGNLPLDAYSTRSNQKNKHHIFPRAHLRNAGFDYQSYNSIANICFLVLKDNLDVGYKPPREYLKDYKRKMYFPRVMRSHLIPYKSESGLWDNNTKSGYKKFLNNRIRIICSAFDNISGAKLFSDE